jgi:hypothetical protein
VVLTMALSMDKLITFPADRRGVGSPPAGHGPRVMSPGGQCPGPIQGSTRECPAEPQGYHFSLTFRRPYQRIIISANPLNQELIKNME